jgi:predicted acetylornithine/succinylornithine family transaminase
VSALGHGHPELVAAVQAQVAKIAHTSMLYLNVPAVELAEKITAACFADMVFFCNSGAEANEAAIKVARRFAYDRGDKKRVRIVSFVHSFHGRTYGALAATAQPKYHEGFGPMPEGFDYVEPGDVEALAKVVTEETAAVIIEPIQAEGGVRMHPPGFLRQIRSLCDAAGALMIVDEVQTGFGRTGRMFAHQHEGIVPDVMSLAKGIGGGLPLGAMVCRAEVGASLVAGTHATTFGTNPVACAAGNVVMNVLTTPGFLEQVDAVGSALMEGLSALGTRRGVFSAVRGRGLLIGAELAKDVPFEAKALVEACRAQGVLTHVAGARVLRLVPALILSEAQAMEGLAAIERAAASLL